jgi:hypothetical protein
MPGELQSEATAVPMRLLCLDPQEPSWTGLAMTLESQLERPLRLRWCDNPALAISLLRSEQFDCIVIACLDRDHGYWTRNPASKVVQAIRSIGCDDPILVLISDAWEQELNPLAELDCEVMSPAKGWETSSLATWMLRAIRRQETHCEHQKLSTGDSRRRNWERGESLSQLQQQREIAARFLENRPTADGEITEPRPRNSIPERVRDYYLELLRTYVIMGTGNLSADLAHLSQGLAQAGVTLPEAFDLHLDCLARLIDGLGLQSLRHIVTRANLLSVEFLLNMSMHQADDPRTPTLGSYGIDLQDASLDA